MYVCYLRMVRMHLCNGALLYVRMALILCTYACYVCMSARNVCSSGLRLCACVRNVRMLCYLCNVRHACILVMYVYM